MKIQEGLMGKIAIISDSNSGIAPKEAKELGIYKERLRNFHIHAVRGKCYGFMG